MSAARQFARSDIPAEHPFDENNTAAENADGLDAWLIANATGSTVKLVVEPGDYKMAWTPNLATLYAAGIRKVVIVPRYPKTVRFLNTALESAITWDNTSRASAPIAVTAISNQLHNVYDFLTRLSVANSNWPKNARVNIQSQDRPEYSTQRFVGEAFRVRSTDASYVYVDGHLEYTYTTSIVARKLDDEMKLVVSGIMFAADGDSSNLSVIDRDKAMITMVAGVDCVIRNCEFDAPWYIAVRFNSCVDCNVEKCKYWNGLNNPAANQLTYGLNCYGACHNCWMIDCFSSGFRHTFTTDGWAASTAYNSNNWTSYGQPTWCGAKRSDAVNAKGAPWDTHEEGSRIFFQHCHADMAHSADEASVFVGAGFQVRCRRVTIENCSSSKCNVGISWKPYEHGNDNWLRVVDTTLTEGTYSSDQSRGIYISTGGTLTNRPRLEVINSSIDLFGNSIETDLAVDINLWGFKSSRPHRTHLNLGAGSAVRGGKILLDSRSANLPNAATANRVVNAIWMEGNAQCHLDGVTHILGSDTTKHTDSIFKSADTTAGKLISLTQYHEQDPSGIGRRPIVFPTHESYFTWVGLDATIRLAKANLPAAGRQGRQAFVTDEVGGPMPVFDNGTNWKRMDGVTTVS